MTSADDDPFYSPILTPSPARVATPGELLFEFIRASDRAPMFLRATISGYGMTGSPSWRCYAAINCPLLNHEDFRNLPSC
jgi:hypothetical protein